ncbi:MAG: M48 family metalloprotease [Pseudomonadota bacterium]|nr:M48 family metalloprotease [Pseudomonadota bacterium]
MNKRSVSRALLACTLTLLCASLPGGEAPMLRAQEVTDKLCKRIVQPFRISDNLIGAATTGVKAKAGSVACRLRGNCPTGDDAERAVRERLIQSNWLPMQAEVRYGERAHALMADLVLERDSRLGKPSYQLADAMLAELTANLREEHPYELKLFVLKNETRNAVAMPGGYLYLDHGLLSDAKYHDKARFALAHELAHVFQRHETRALQALIVDSYGTQDDLGKLLDDMKRKPDAVIDRVQLEKDVYVRHQIDQELQSDACSARILARAYPEGGKAPDAVRAFVQDLPATEPAPASAAAKQASPAAAGQSRPAPQQAVGIGVKMQELAASPDSRHPTSAERVKNLQIVQADVASTK